jgi:hypothetical protein
MPLALAILALDALFLVHAAKTGRLCPWGYVILAIPIVGAVAYVIVELIPEWMGSVQGRQVCQRVAKTIEPEKRYNKLSDHLTMTDSVANRVALAEECLGLGKYDEAKRHYDAALAQPQGDNPAYMLGRARAEFGQGRPQKAISTLDTLKQFWPDYQSADGHMLYARALEDCGRVEEALDEYQALARYHSGAEPRVRCGLLLGKLGRTGDARTQFAEVIAQMHRAPKYIRRMQAEWIALAEKGLRV